MPAATAIVEQEVLRTLKDKPWVGEDEAVLAATGIAERVKARAMAELRLPRYKLATYVVVGENLQQGVRVASRCLWDAETDGYATFHYRSDALFCTAILFAVYTE